MHRVRLLSGALAVVLAVAAPAFAQGETDEKATGYIEMPASTDGSYTLASKPGSGHNWGRPEFIHFLIAVSSEWHRRHPDLPQVCVGDMSHKDGSDFPPHKTHKDGLTADIVTRPKNICDIHYDRPEIQVELAELFVAYGARQILFNGDAVVAKVKGAQKHELHDDHYHVVLDPKKLPDDSKPVLLPASELADGATFGGSSLEQGKLVLRWLSLGAVKPKTLRVTCGEWSATVKPTDTSVKVPLPLEHGASLRWKLEAELASGESVGFDWQTIKADLVAPTIELDGPADGATIPGVPELAWRFVKEGAAQASFVVELSDQGTKKPSIKIGPIGGKEASFALRMTRLGRGVKWHWRIRALDAHGDEGVSEWRAFRTGQDWKFTPIKVTCPKALELKGADGSVIAKLKKGEVLLATGEGDERLIVQTTRGQEGFVRRDDVTIPK